MDGYHQHAEGGKFVTYDRLSAMGTNGFQEPAVDFKDGKIIGTKRLYADGKFGKSGKAQFMATQWRGLEASGKQQEKEKFAYLINNGRANHVCQTIYLDQYNDFVMDRWPLPFLELNPEDMKELGAQSRRSRRGLQRQRLDPGDGAAAADRKPQANLHAVRVSRPGRWETSYRKASTS
jgi:arsenite oxidase large subunit